MLSVGLFVTVLSTVLAVRGISLESRQSVTQLTAAQVSSYKPYTYYAGAAYCSPSKTLTWTCGCR